MIKKFKYKGSQPRILEESKILIIEDNKVERMILEQLFTKYGFKNIFEAEN